MTKNKKLNIASDLKRIAYWVAVGDESKKELIKKLWCTVGHQIQQNKNPITVLKYRKERLILAEEILLTSIRLQYN